MSPEDEQTPDAEPVEGKGNRQDSVTHDPPGAKEVPELPEGAAGPSRSRWRWQPDGLPIDSRADRLIELARNTKRGRYSLMKLLTYFLVASAALAILKGMGIFANWPRYRGLFWTGSYVFAPLLCFSLAVWFWPRPVGHNLVAAIGSVVIGLAFWGFLIMERANPFDMLAAAVFGAIFWAIQAFCLVTVQQLIFRDRVKRRELPEELPKQDKT